MMDDVTALLDSISALKNHPALLSLLRSDVAVLFKLWFLPSAVSFPSQKQEQRKMMYILLMV